MCKGGFARLGACPLLLASLLLAQAAGPLADLRVGEEGNIARVVVVCTGRCAASPGGIPGTYRIDGLSDEVDVAVDGDLVRRLTVTPDGEASVLTMTTARPSRRQRMSRCQPEAVCFDMDLSDAPSPPRPPSLGTIAREVDAFALRGAPTTFHAALERVSGEALSPDACTAARERLMADAYALDAFRTHALCVAADGAPGEADGYLARLQTYAPDEEVARLRALLAERAEASPKR